MEEYPAGKLIVFTAPSGSGKTTIVRHILSTFRNVGFSVSATNRKKRPHEKHGHDYYFLSSETFRMWIDEHAFVEWEEVYSDQFYGTLKFEIERLWAMGKHVVFDMDVKGATSIKAAYPDQTTVIFIKVPTLDMLIERLKKRRTESEASLRKRIERIKDELTYENTFDYVLINDTLETALAEAEQLTRAIITGNPVNALARHGNIDN